MSQWSNLIWLLVLSIFKSISTEPEGAIPTIDDLSACKPFQRPLIITKPYGYIVSPQYSDNGLYPYPEGSDCSWTLVAPKNYVINMKMLTQDLDNWSDETRISFYDGQSVEDDLIDTFTGTKWRKFRTQSNQLHIKFISGKRPSGVIPQYKGFKLYFEHNRAPVKCKEDQLRCANEEECIPKENICNGIDECRDGTDEENCSDGHYNSTTSCGIRPNLITQQSEVFPYPFLMAIAAGDAAIPNSWPWMVSLRNRRTEPSGHYCGGSLIGNQWVLTAAHCFLSDPDPKAYTIALGKHRSLIHDEKEITRYLIKIISHPKFDRATKTGDLALVKLNAPISPVESWISPICLPNKMLKVEPGTMLTIIGWGDVQSTGNPYVLKEGVIPLISNAICSEWLQNETPDSLMCAGYEEGGTDTCKGDSGGPIMMKLNDSWIAVGVASYGLPCCGCVRQPGVYTRVEPHLDWIKETIEKNK
ncbi:enteropeptidase isoform X2 [Tetranychus urticae]|uniref:Acrosin n=2 Tax=Tetranychus urticae TaxID=32264 RepID=T1KS87_TETUR|nr:enteropeptidase isoform X2 [Tetranychus urticae]XP_015789838.1 enteropeptidase isoform X2 [Tetranychus urticae]